MLWWRQGYAVDEKCGFCGNLGRLRIHTELCCGVQRRLKTIWLLCWLQNNYMEGSESSAIK